MFTTPEASPARSSGTADTAAADVGPLTRPVPTPAIRKPGHRSAYVEPTSTRETRYRPSAIARNPRVTGARAPKRCTRRPTTSDTANRARLSGSRAAPDLTAE